jgi:hypothetical protein
VSRGWRARRTNKLDENPSPHTCPLFCLVSRIVASLRSSFLVVTANDAELNHTRRRLSVLSDNKLVDGVDNLNLDAEEEPAATSASVSAAVHSLLPLLWVSFAYS